MSLIIPDNFNPLFVIISCIVYFLCLSTLATKRVKGEKYPCDFLFISAISLSTCLYLLFATVKDRRVFALTAAIFVFAGVCALLIRSLCCVKSERLLTNDEERFLKELEWEFIKENFNGQAGIFIGKSYKEFVSHRE